MILDGGFTGDEAAGGYVIERSLRFNAASSQYLTRTFSTPTNNTVWTWSKWLKRGSLGSIQCLFSAGSAGVFFNVFNQLIFTSNAGATLATSPKVFLDPSAHGHLKVSSDGTTITAHWNNELCLSYTGTIQNINSAIAHNIGRNAGGSNQHFEGYDSEDVFVDGQALPPSNFGEINTSTGQWVAKRYTGSYGTNGFCLDFKDGTSTTTLGHDKSGNNNHWALTNFTLSAGVNDCWMLDVPAGNGSASAVQPSGNYCLLSPLTPSSLMNGGIISNSGLTFIGAYDGGICPVLPSFASCKGFAYLELEARSNGGYGLSFLGARTPSTTVFKSMGNGGDPGFTSYGIYGCAIDFDSGKIWFRNPAGNWISGDPVAATAPSLTYTPTGNDAPYIATFRTSGSVNPGWLNINFGQRSFAYTPPSGFKALCTANLPTPSIKKPSDHFNVQLSTGANIKTDSEALFTNELEWIKDRANANNHQLIDSVRGTNAVLQSNTTAAETTYTAPSGSSVGWVWRASDSVAVTNNVGTISSQVSANPTAGFSIVTYTGNGANATVGHGLGIAPKMVIVKNIGTTGNWQVRHGDIAVANSIQLNLSNPPASATTVWNSTAPTSSVISIGTDASVNGNTNTYVAYCFAEIAGYSKFGSSTGNGSADGPFVYCGFRPRLVMAKRIDTTGDWLLMDSARDTKNAMSARLYPNLSQAEDATPVIQDFTSNGFKLRSAAPYNVSSGTYIYMAFAETPFNYANAR